MNLPNKWTSDLLSKDRQKSQAALGHIINTPDLEAWKCLIDNSDYLFTYIKDRVGQNLINAINNSNANNLFSLMKYHSPDWDYYIAKALKNNSNEDINSRLLELLKSGTEEEKSYAAKYFSLTKDINARQALFEATKQEYQPLKDNTAEALGKLNDLESYNYYLDKLNSEDDWEKVESAGFLSKYGNKEAIISILEAMTNSSMSEYIAGEAVSLVKVNEILENQNENIQLLALEALDSILASMPEVWSLSSLMDFQIYETLDKLINLAKENPDSNLSGKYAQVLLKAKSKFSLFFENTEYTFDEEKTILNELEETFHLLSCEDEDFWNKQVKNLIKELNIDDVKRKLAAIAIINELECVSIADSLVELLSKDQESEIVICETILTLSKFNLTTKISNLNTLVSNVKDQNLLAIIQNSVVSVL